MFSECFPVAFAGVVRSVVQYRLRGIKITAFTLLDDDSKKYFQRDLQLICLILLKIRISAP